MKAPHLIKDVNEETFNSLFAKNRVNKNWTATVEHLFQKVHVNGLKGTFAIIFDDDLINFLGEHTGELKTAFINKFNSIDKATLDQEKAS